MFSLRVAWFCSQPAEALGFKPVTFVFSRTQTRGDLTAPDFCRLGKRHRVGGGTDLAKGFQQGSGTPSSTQEVPP